ncbi:MAG: glucose-6-phosphate isomerase [Verrucomicrobia bacterium]|nr:glucose-6-phosphate isomerase [Verrucomicrobiota bacterium]
MPFNDYPASVQLKKLAQNPPDLTKILTPHRLEEMTAEAAGLRLFYGAERVHTPELDALFALAEEAKVIKKMEAMQRGNIVNVIEGYPSENRPALHTAMRDFFEAPLAPEATKLAKTELDKLQKFTARLDIFTDLVQIGIGGSALGPQAVYLGLEAFKKPGKNVHFLSNVDPDEAARIFSQLDLAKTVVVVVSKSGSTLETLTNETIARGYFEKSGINPQLHFVAVTGKGSPMDNPSHYAASFYMWDYVGGRYSATSMVGLVALAFALPWERVLSFLEGAHTMDRIALGSDPRKNLPLLSALLGIWNRNFLGFPTVGVIPYSQALSRFPAHLQQLDMESNGKHVGKEGKHVAFSTGPIVWGEPGTNGQHSFFQLLHQGTNIVPLEFIGFTESQYRQDQEVAGSTSQQKLVANLLAQAIALAQGDPNPNPNKSFAGNRPSRILMGKQLDAFTMGAILAYYEHKVAFQGFCWNINSFDQEGVQLGKTLALKVIDQMTGKKRDFPLAGAWLKKLP